MTTSNTIATEQAGLLDITDVKPFSAEDQQCFNELKEVLQRHGALQRFGVTLLHTHFPIHEGELLVEECDEAGRTLTLPAHEAIRLERGEFDANELAFGQRGFGSGLHRLLFDGWGPACRCEARSDLVSRLTKFAEAREMQGAFVARHAVGGHNHNRKQE